MKSIKENARNMRRQEQSSEDQRPEINEDQLSQSEQPSESQLQQQQIIRESQPQSQQKSSDILISSPVYDPEVGYEKGHYIIEKIKLRRWNLQKRQFEYLIKWKGYSDKQCTWQNTEDIIGEPCLQLKDLGKNTLLSIFERTHAKTLIYDQTKNKVVKEYLQTRKNHLKYAPKELIQQMDREMQQIYGKKKQQNKIEQKSNVKQQLNPNPSVKLEFGRTIEQQKKTVNQPVQSSQILKGYRVKNITIQKLLYFPLQFELKMLVHSNSDSESKRLLTFEDIMNVDPQIGIFCYKTKLAMIEKWKKQNLIKTSVKG